MQSNRPARAGTPRRNRRFSEIRRPVTPERRARIDAIKVGMAASEQLAQLRAAAGVSQSELAGELGVTQGNVSQLERRGVRTLSVATLAGYIEALGGKLRLQADMPEGTYSIDLDTSPG